MSTARLAACTWVLAASAWLAGCGGAEFGPDPRVPSEKRYILTSGPAPEGPVSLPASGPFNIHLKSSSQNPGSGGTARGASDALPEGRAFCAAEAAEGGTAQAEFKIGHRIENRTGEVRRAVVQADCTVRHQIETSAEPAPETVAKADLHLVVLDPVQRAVVKIAVLQADSDAAAGGGSFSLSRGLTIAMSPGTSYDVVLFAKAQASAAAGQEARVRVDLDELRMSFTFGAAGTATSN